MHAGTKKMYILDPLALTKLDYVTLHMKKSLEILDSL